MGNTIRPISKRGGGWGGVRVELGVVVEGESHFASSANYDL